MQSVRLDAAASRGDPSIKNKNGKRAVDFVRDAELKRLLTSKTK